MNKKLLITTGLLALALLTLSYCTSANSLGGGTSAVQPPSETTDAAVRTLPPSTYTPQPTPRSWPTNPPPTATPTERPTPTIVAPTFDPTWTPWFNAQGSRLVRDHRGHLMALIPAKTFVMGLTDDQKRVLCSLLQPYTECDPENPQAFEGMYPAFEYTLTHDYWMDVYEVTNAQYRACEETGRCAPPTTEDSFWVDNYYHDPAYDDYPVMSVRWEDAYTFCDRWRGARLPTEAEWEHAARGADGRLWPWGNAIPTESLANFLPYRFFGESVNDPLPVGSYPAGVSPFGLYDMAGNVEEWVADWYWDYQSILEGALAPTPQLGLRVARGGSSADGPIEASTAFRHTIDVSEFRGGLGFRCARAASP